MSELSENFHFKDKSHTSSESTAWQSEFSERPIDHRLEMICQREGNSILLPADHENANQCELNAEEADDFDGWRIIDEKDDATISFTTDDTQLDRNKIQNADVDKFEQINAIDKNGNHQTTRKTENDSNEMAPKFVKFCADCGTKFKFDTDKFCTECGIRRQTVN